MAVGPSTAPQAAEKLVIRDSHHGCLLTNYDSRITTHRGFTMTIKINEKITGYEVAKKDEQEGKPAESNVVHMHEKVERPEILLGSTYKIKTPLTEHALYLTINDIVLNHGTPHERRQPFEIFINSKNMDHFQWVVALTRVISAVFPRGGTAPFRGGGR